MLPFRATVYAAALVVLGGDSGCAPQAPVEERSSPSAAPGAGAAAASAPVPPELGEVATDPARTPARSVLLPRKSAPTRRTLADWKHRLAASRKLPEERLPTLSEGLEAEDPSVRKAAITEVEREPRAVAASLLLPLVESSASQEEAARAAEILVRHFRAFDFPDGEPDATDLRIFDAIGGRVATSNSTDATAFVRALARMFQLESIPGKRHEAASRAHELGRGLALRSGTTKTTPLRHALEERAPTDERARALLLLFGP